MGAGHLQEHLLYTRWYKMATLNEHKTEIKAAHPTLNKMVDGVMIELTKSEYDATVNEWAEARYQAQEVEAVKRDGGKHANYAEFRREAYASIGDQLDMQYKDAVNGTTTWKDHVAAVKAKFEKP